MMRFPVCTVVIRHALCHAGGTPSVFATSLIMGVGRFPEDLALESCVIPRCRALISHWGSYSEDNGPLKIFVNDWSLPPPLRWDGSVTEESGF